LKDSKDQEIKELITRYLLTGEKILWFQHQKQNLAGVIYRIFTILIGSFVFVPLLILIAMFTSNPITLPIVLFGIYLPIASASIFHSLIVYLTRKKRLNLSYRQLKNYEVLNVLTNQRYIKRDYKFAYNEKDMDEHFKDEAVKKENDLVYVDRNRIDHIGINYFWKGVFFFVNQLDYSYLRIFFETKNEMDSFLQIMKDTFLIELVEEKDQLAFKYKVL
jgi:hypothetical protein